MGIYNVKVIEYHKEIQVNFYNYGISKEEENDKANKQRSNDSQQSIKDNKQDTNDSNKEIENKKRSTRRSKQHIYEIARANEWEWFATFTFKENRYDYIACKDRLRKWFDNFKRRKCPDFEYLCVPERHKDGAYHFHALIKGNITSYIDSKGWNEEKYVFKDYKLGINELERVRDTNRVSMYITKYISKDLLGNIKNARRYFYSKGVEKPTVKEYYVKSDNPMEFLDSNFPNMKITYVTNAEYGQKLVQYIQLKERDLK